MGRMTRDAQVWPLGAVDRQPAVVQPRLTPGSCPHCEALHMASANGHADIVGLLLAAGAVSAQQLLCSERSDPVYLCRTCCVRQAVNMTNAQGNTPLHWACLNGHVQVRHSPPSWLCTAAVHLVTARCTTIAGGKKATGCDGHCHSAEQVLLTSAVPFICRPAICSPQHGSVLILCTISAGRTAMDEALDHGHQVGFVLKVTGSCH